MVVNADVGFVFANVLKRSAPSVGIFIGSVQYNIYIYIHCKPRGFQFLTNFDQF